MADGYVTWDDLPPRPWPDAVEPSSDALADYLMSLSREHLVWLLGKQRGTWAQESDCFLRDHEGEISRLRHSVEMAHKVIFGPDANSDLPASGEAER